jgi:hypothetical protein
VSPMDVFSVGRDFFYRLVRELNMNGDAGYALKKLELAILLLATGRGDVRSRLVVKCLSHGVSCSPRLGLSRQSPTQLVVD